MKNKEIKYKDCSSCMHFNFTRTKYWCGKDHNKICTPIAIFKKELCESFVKGQSNNLDY